MTAILSACGIYRYALSRPADDLSATAPPVVFLMLNPSTADATTDDRTVSRCRGYARIWGRAGIVIVNLYALRATDPTELWRHPDPMRSKIALSKSFGCAGKNRSACSVSEQP